MRNPKGARAISPRFSPALLRGQSPSFDEIEGLLTIVQIAEKLNLTRRGVEGMVARRLIPVVKLSRRCLRFRWSEVETAINRYRVKEIC